MDSVIFNSVLHPASLQCSIHYLRETVGVNHIHQALKLFWLIAPNQSLALYFPAPPSYFATLMDPDCLPGGNDFEDVTAVFQAASQGTLYGDVNAIRLTVGSKICNPEALFSTRTSHCTMQWLPLRCGYVPISPTVYLSSYYMKIGKPLFDSGLVLLNEQTPVFNPLMPLLPEEVCWIIDHAFACEVNQSHACTYLVYERFMARLAQMEWHTGYTLAQTVFSFIYVHALPEIDPDIISPSPVLKDKLRPIELITVVLRASVLGLLKCCDLSWVELDKGNLHDVCPQELAMCSF